MDQDRNTTSAGEQRLIHLLEIVMPHYGRVIRQALSEIGDGDRLTIPQFRAMQAIAGSGSNGALNLTLARQLGVAAPSMTAMIDGLVERGLVDRSIDPANRRQVIIVLTANGDERYHAISEAIEHRLESGLDAITPVEQQALLESLERLDRVLSSLPDGTNRPSTG